MMNLKAPPCSELYNEQLEIAVVSRYRWPLDQKGLEEDGRRMDGDSNCESGGDVDNDTDNDGDNEGGDDD
uniref:Uncharacterized protein n=1 Tax=Setaria digitata TaxID=48799 RepID=A0A915Q6D3_9BILA